MSELLGIRAYARHRGCSPAAVRKAIRDGRLAESLREGADGRQLIDAGAADREWSATTDPAKQRSAEPSPAARAVQGTLFGGDAGGNAAGRTGELKGLTRALVAARALRQVSEARIKKQEHDLRTGRVGRMQAMRAEAFSVHRMIRDRLLHLSDRLRGPLAAETDPDRVHETLSREIEQALADLSLELQEDEEPQAATG